MAPSSSRISLPSADVDAAFRRQLETIFDEELAGVVERFQQARYRALRVAEARIGGMSVALGAAEAALVDVRAELQAVREKMLEMTAASDVAVARGAGRIKGLKDTVSLQAARILELEGRLQDQIAYSNRLGAQAARVPKLEGRIAELVAVEAQFLKAAKTRTGAGPRG